MGYKNKKVLFSINIYLKLCFNTKIFCKFTLFYQMRPNFSYNLYKIVLTDNCPKYDNKLFQLYIAPIDQRWLNGIRLKNQILLAYF